MHIDAMVAVAGLLVGGVVGLTGMGGGALMTPILVLLFGIQPLAAVSSDLVASFIMKPIGGSVHVRRGTVNRELVRWLVTGSVPCAFLGVLLLRALGDGEAVSERLKVLLGATLLVAAAAMIAKGAVDRRRATDRADHAPLVVRPLPTAAIGAIGGVVVGMTSVGSGSLIIVMLLLLYPRLRASELVGTDLVQAIPLVGSAALGHLLFGDLRIGLTTSLLIGSIPGVYIGARISAQGRDQFIRPVLVVVLLASALKLLGVGTVALGIVLGAGLAVRLGIWTLRQASGRGKRAENVPVS